ncbi:hypothetical protein QQ045_014276 [Rhodiola kirilowii]
MYYNIILIFGIVYLLTWQAICSPSFPKLSILYVHLPAFNTSSATPQNSTSLTFKFKIVNPKGETDIHYNNLSGTHAKVMGKHEL